MSGQTPILKATRLVRTFESVMAVRDVSFEIHAGQVVGFIGANGAGKTTTMRMLATLDLPDSGRIELMGHDAVNFPDRVRSHLGWMPDAFGFYDNVSIEEYLDFYARAYGLQGGDRRRRVEEIIEFTELGTLRDRLMNKLSKGMGQRLCLARCLINDPSVLLMDEPAAGLDPKARIEFKNLVRILAGQGKTILISSHILSELGEMCDTMLFIDKGQIVHHGSAETLKRGDSSVLRIEIEVTGPPDPLLAWAQHQPALKLVETTNRGGRFDFSSGQEDDVAQLLRRAVMEGVPISDFHRLERRLEDAFVDMLRRENQTARTEAADDSKE